MSDRTRRDEADPELARLPAGRHGLPRDFVARNQRERLIVGLAIAVATKGYEATTVEDINKAAGVSRRTFYKNFDSKQDCFLAAFGIVAENLRQRVLADVDPSDDWPHRVRSALASLLSFLSAEPELARLCIVEPQLAGGEVAARYRETLRSVLPHFRAGRPPRPDGRPVPDSVDDMVVGGVASFLAARINADEADALEDRLPDLLEFVLTPFIGSAESERLAAESGSSS